MHLTSIISIPQPPSTTKAQILPSTTTSIRCHLAVGMAASALRARFKSALESSFKQSRPKQTPHQRPDHVGALFFVRMICAPLRCEPGRGYFGDADDSAAGGVSLAF